MVLSEFTYWSVTHGAEVIRLSTADDQGQEFYTFMPSVMGKSYRLLRKKAADALEAAVDGGMRPGEVRWR